MIIQKLSYTTCSKCSNSARFKITLKNESTTLLCAAHYQDTISRTKENLIFVREINFKEENNFSSTSVVTSFNSKKSIPVSVKEKESALKKLCRLWGIKNLESFISTDRFFLPVETLKNTSHNENSLILRFHGIDLYLSNSMKSLYYRIRDSREIYYL